MPTQGLHNIFHCSDASRFAKNAEGVVCNVSSMLSGCFGKVLKGAECGRKRVWEWMGMMDLGLANLGRTSLDSFPTGQVNFTDTSGNRMCFQHISRETRYRCLAVQSGMQYTVIFKKALLLAVSIAKPVTVVKTTHSA